MRDSNSYINPEQTVENSTTSIGTIFRITLNFYRINLPISRLIMLFNLRSIAVMALAILSVSASLVDLKLNEVAQPLDRRADTSPLMRRSDFHWRFCELASDPSSLLLGLF